MRGFWSLRIARAEALAERHPPAADILRFYTKLARYQQSLAAEWSGTPWEPAIVLQALPATLNWFEANGPSGLSGAAPGFHDKQPRDWQRTLARYLAEDAFDAGDVSDAFVIEALLQPLAAMCAAAEPRSPVPGPRSQASGRCPFCHHRPAAGVLRDAGQGTRRSLVCGLCFTEWSFERIGCPSCGERKFDELPVYTAEQVDVVRLECCDTCGVYLKTIDASKDGTVVPLVDDLATLPLDLWARERGYRRLRPSFYL